MIEFIKKNLLLALAPKRNRLGDLVVGWNRAAINKSEQVTIEQANLFLEQDVEKARKFIDRHAVKSDALVFVAFYLGRRRWKEMEPLIQLVKHGEKVKAALTVSNSKWFSNHPSLGSEIGQSLLKDGKLNGS